MYAFGRVCVCDKMILQILDSFPKENCLLREELELTHTWWRRPIGCLKLQVNFHKKNTYYRALLQKMTYEDKASYGSSPLCSF